MAWWSNIAGTVTGYLRLGLSGVRLKNSAGNLLVRNAGDSADAEITASKINISAPSSVRVSSANGYGSTNTKIRRFTNTQQNVGSDITYADSATLGALFTINANGNYAISYTDSFSVAGSAGISLNTTQPTISIFSISEATRLCADTSATTDYISNCGTVAYLTAGSVIRPHTDGVAAGSIPAATSFTICRVS